MEISDLPTLNAALNGLSGCLLLAGWFSIRRGKRDVHKRFMLAAVGTSTLFLISYLTYHALATALTTFPRDDHPTAAPVYYAILISHTLLAAATLPLVIITLLRALRGDFIRHKKIAPWTFAIWLYVSITGVLIYLMLYVWFPA